MRYKTTIVDNGEAVRVQFPNSDELYIFYPVDSIDEAAKTAAVSLKHWLDSTLFPEIEKDISSQIAKVHELLFSPVRDQEAVDAEDILCKLITSMQVPTNESDNNNNT